jgi:hypothetical protein
LSEKLTTLNSYSGSNSGLGFRVINLYSSFSTIQQLPEKLKDSTIGIIEISEVWTKTLESSVSIKCPRSSFS